MKSFFMFLAGVLVGVLVPMAVNSDSSFNSNIITSEQEGKIIARYELKVFQVLNQNEALVFVGTFPHEQVCLLSHDGKELYYNNQKIIIPSGMVARQFGVYQYETKEHFINTVPAIRIERIKK